MVKKETPEGAGAEYKKTAIDYNNEAMFAMNQYLKDNNYKKFEKTIRKIQNEINQDNNLAPFERLQLFTELFNLLVDV